MGTRHRDSVTRGQGIPKDNMTYMRLLKIPTWHPGAAMPLCEGNTGSGLAGGGGGRWSSVVYQTLMFMSDMRARDACSVIDSPMTQRHRRFRPSRQQAAKFRGLPPGPVIATALAPTAPCCRLQLKAPSAPGRRWPGGFCAWRYQGRDRREARETQTQPYSTNCPSNQHYSRRCPYITKLLMELFHSSR